MSVSGDGNEAKAFIADDMNIGERMDAFIASQMPPHVSRSRIKDIVKQGGVTLNGQVCDTPNKRLQSGDQISLIIPEPEDATPKPENIALDIFFEDEHLLVVNKPAGLVVHPAAGNWTGTLVNALLYHCGGSLSGIGGVRRPGIVHRLDKDTSGLLVVAKTEQAHAGLTAQFADHGRNGPLVRAYLALIWGAPSRKTGTIDAPLTRSTGNRMKRMVAREDHSQAKNAVTHYAVQEELSFDNDAHPLASLIECRLETGRTHQIRVHMNHIGCPLIGDRDYGQHFKSKAKALPEALQKTISGFRRQALHAALLGFKHPVSGEYQEYESPLPYDFATLLENFRALRATK